MFRGDKFWNKVTGDPVVVGALVEVGGDDDKVDTSGSYVVTVTPEWAYLSPQTWVSPERFAPHHQSRPCDRYAATGTGPLKTGDRAVVYRAVGSNEWSIGCVDLFAERFAAGPKIGQTWAGKSLVKDAFEGATAVIVARVQAIEYPGKSEDVGDTYDIGGKLVPYDASQAKAWPVLADKRKDWKITWNLATGVGVVCDGDDLVVFARLINGVRKPFIAEIGAFMKRWSLESEFVPDPPEPKSEDEIIGREPGLHPSIKPMTKVTRTVTLSYEQITALLGIPRAQHFEHGAIGLTWSWTVLDDDGGES